MKISDQGIELLVAREGKRNDAYLDTQNIPTIGVGHTGPEVHLGLHWTDEQVMDAFRKDIERFEAAITRAVVVALVDYQFDALVSFAFNVGTGAATSSTLMKKVNEEKFDEAAAQFDRWHIPPEITSRRNGEREQFKGTAFEPTIP